MHEIEIKMKFRDKAAVIAKLQSLGATFKEKYTLRDTYFSPDQTDMREAKNLLRIRTKNDHAELTFKGVRESDAAIWKRIELTTGISDAETLVKILEHLSFNRLLDNESTREYWMLGDAEIAFITLTLPVSLAFLEIEAPSEASVASIVAQLNGLAEAVDESYFKVIDEARSKK